MTAARFMADLAAIAAERFERGEVDRRGLLALCGGLAGLAPALLRSAQVAAQVKEIVVVNAGGSAAAAWQAAWGDPFAAESGLKVTTIGGELAPGSIREQVESGRVTWDCTDGDLFYGPILGPRGLVQRYDYGKVDRAKVRPEFVTEWGCAAYLYSTVNGYNVEKCGGRAPDGFKDYLNFRDFPGKRAMHSYPAGSLEAVLIGAGVEPDALYPLDVARALALVREHRHEFLFWEDGAASQRLFREGEVAMGCLWSTRASLLDRETAGRITWAWDHGIVAPGAIQVLPNNPAGPAVFDFIASTQDPRRQVELLRLLGSGPANPAAAALAPPELQRIDCGYEPNYRRQVPLSTGWYAENHERVQAEFREALAG